ncbi:unnamed protein product, partial [Rotaria sp. Silwood1]
TTAITTTIPSTTKTTTTTTATTSTTTTTTIEYIDDRNGSIPKLQFTLLFSHLHSEPIRIQRS